MNNKRMSWYEAREYLWKFNEKHNITSKGGNTAQCTMVAVITEDSFEKKYDEKSRSYVFTNHNKAFIPNMFSNSIFSKCLDGTDNGVRLDFYVGKEWKVDYCYILEENGGIDEQ